MTVSVIQFECGRSVGTRGSLIRPVDKTESLESRVVLSNW